MNSLSIMIYVVGVAEKLQDNIGGAGFLVGVLCVLFAIGYAIAIGNSVGTSDYNKYDRELANRFIPGLKSGLRWSISIAVILSLLNFLFPTKQTMIMIAASEVSEKIITSETAQSALNQVGGVSADAMTLLKTYIAKEQAELTKEIAEAVAPKEKETK